MLPGPGRPSSMQWFPVSGDLILLHDRAVSASPGLVSASLGLVSAIPGLVSASSAVVSAIQV